jgi:hypothetical protein
MAYFRPFSNVISIKTSRAAQKNTSNMAATSRASPLYVSNFMPRKPSIVSTKPIIFNPAKLQLEIT